MQSNQITLIPHHFSHLSAIVPVVIFLLNLLYFFHLKLICKHSLTSFSNSADFLSDLFYVDDLFDKKRPTPVPEI